jgi:hypothetical protein
LSGHGSTLGVMKPSTHIGCLDESCHNTGRFRSLSVVSVPAEHHAELMDILTATIRESGFQSELKWTKVKTAKGRFAATKVIDLTADWVSTKRLRVDTLTWDTKDHRHAIRGRDDAANIGRMHHHLLMNALGKRWGTNTAWLLYPDESNVDWDVLSDCLHFGERKRLRKHPEDPRLFGAGSNLGFAVCDVQQKKSHEDPIIQVADFFAGVAAWTASNYDLYQRTASNHSGQVSLFGDDDAPKTSNSERYRCEVVAHLLDECSRHRFGVSAKNRYLKTMQGGGGCGLNFWHWVPQGEYDKAPTREGRT